MSKTYFSEFKSDIAVAILTKDDHRYEVMKPLFEQCGFEPCKPFAHYKEDINSVYLTKLISNN